MVLLDFAPAVMDRPGKNTAVERAGIVAKRFRPRNIRNWKGAMRSLLLLIGLCMNGCTLAAAENPEEWYFRAGPRAGSLKSDRPLPLYDKNPDHLWNRLFAALYIRPGEDPSPGRPRRIEGGDAYLDPLLWPETLHFSESEVLDRVDRLLDEFLTKQGAERNEDPFARALLQHDLWAVHDRLANQNLIWSRSRDSKIRELAQRRETMFRKLAQAIKALALSKAEIAALPENYAAALQSGHFAVEHRFDPQSDYLPADLPTGPSSSTTGAWMEITYPDHVPPYHTHDFGGRSYFRIFYRFPEGRKAVVDYLEYVAEEGVDKQHPDASRRAVLKSKELRHIPAGTQLALLRQMVVLDKDLNPVPTSVVQELRMRIFKNVEGKAAPETTSGEGVNIHAYELKRALALDGLKYGGLERQPNGLKVYRPLFHFPEDWGRAKGREGLAFLPVATHCMACHGHKPGENVGSYSMTSLHAAFSLAGANRNGPPGIVTPMPAAAPSQARRAVAKVRSRQEYLLLVHNASASTDAELKEPSATAANVAKNETPKRVTHYAFVSTGDSMRAPLKPIYWAVNQRIQEMLAAYGYPDEAVYCFCEQGVSKGPRVDGKATAANFKKTFEHLAKIMEKEDCLFIFIIGHGSPARGDFIHPLCDRMISATELKGMLDPLPSKNLTIAINACHGGGFIPKLSQPGRVILTPTTDKESNGAKWPEHLTVALFPPGSNPETKFPGARIDFSGIKIDASGDGRISMKEAYNAALLSGVRLYGDKLREHPLLDDNGDGVGHFGKDDEVDGDGKLAADRYLGAGGKPLQFSAAALQRLKEVNARLILE